MKFKVHVVHSVIACLVLTAVTTASGQGSSASLPPPAENSTAPLTTIQQKYNSFGAHRRIRELRTNKYYRNDRGRGEGFFKGKGGRRGKGARYVGKKGNAFERYRGKGGKYGGYFKGKGRYFKGKRRHREQHRGKKDGKRKRKRKHKHKNTKYKKRVTGVDCRQFDFGNGFRPYYRDGRGKGKGGGGFRGIFDRSLEFQGQGCRPNTFDTAKSNPDLSIFVELVKAAGLDSVFHCAGPFTVLAPSNDAFNKNPALLDYLRNPANRDDLMQTLLYHILPGFYVTSYFEDRLYLTIQGGSVDVSTRPLLFNQASVQTPDILACNGVTHVVNDALIPPGTLMKI